MVTIDPLLYPEHPLEGRALSWIPEGTKRVLDGGCSHGYGTRFWVAKAKAVIGADIALDSIEVARSRYPEIPFYQCSLDHTPFESAQFDCITLLDCLEHVEDEITTLNEMDRLLQTGGTLIISTPHRGAFGWLDPFNYGYNLRTKLPALYRLIFRATHHGKGDPGGVPQENPEHFVRHRHYTIGDFRDMLDRSTFCGHYTIDKVSRTGLLLEGIGFTIEALIRLVVGRRLGFLFSRPFVIASKIEYWIPFGSLAYNIMIRVRKTS
jgi:SAM-dependent methyltransferase